VSTCIVANAVNVTARVMSPRAWFFITSNLFKAACVVVSSASLPYCRIGFIYGLYVAFSIDIGLLHLLLASLFRILAFPYFFN
jgi:hypothetical protein